MSENNIADDLISLAAMFQTGDDDAPLTIEQATGILEMLPGVRDRLTARIARAHQSLLNRLRAGEEVPGYAAVEKLGNRRWINVDAATQALAAAGLTEDQVTDRKLKGPAQIEKLLNLERCFLKADVDLDALTIRDSEMILRRTE
jgi:hypothetical protein